MAVIITPAPRTVDFFTRWSHILMWGLPLCDWRRWCLSNCFVDWTGIFGSNKLCGASLCFFKPAQYSGQGPKRFKEQNYLCQSPMDAARFGWVDLPWPEPNQLRAMQSQSLHCSHVKISFSNSCELFFCSHPFFLSPPSNLLEDDAANLPQTIFWSKYSSRFVSSYICHTD